MQIRRRPRTLKSKRGRDHSAVPSVRRPRRAFDWRASVLFEAAEFDPYEGALSGRSSRLICDGLGTSPVFFSRSSAVGSCLDVTTKGHLPEQYSVLSPRSRWRRSRRRLPRQGMLKQYGYAMDRTMANEGRAGAHGAAPAIDGIRSAPRRLRNTETSIR